MTPLPPPRVYSPVEIARQFRFVRETLGPNRGAYVDAFNRVAEAPQGSSWCMSFASFVLWVCYQGPAPLPRTGSCAVALEVAKQLGLVVTRPAVDDVFFRVDDTGYAHHVGFVSAIYPDDASRVGTIAGNTSADGMSSNGTGVFEHDIAIGPSVVFVGLPARVFP